MCLNVHKLAQYHWERVKQCPPHCSEHVSCNYEVHILKYFICTEFGKNENKKTKSHNPVLTYV